MVEEKSFEELEKELLEDIAFDIILPNKGVTEKDIKDIKKSDWNVFEDRFSTLKLFGRFISFKTFSDSIDSKLGFEIKLFSNLFVHKMMQTKLMFNIMFKSFVRSVLTSFSIIREQFKKLWILQNLQFYCSTTFHNIQESIHIYKSMEEGSSMGVQRQFLP